MGLPHGWWPRYGPVLIGCTVGWFSEPLLDREPVTERQVLGWVVATSIAVVVTWLVFRWLDRRRGAESSDATHR